MITQTSAETALRTAIGEAIQNVLPTDEGSHTPTTRTVTIPVSGPLTLPHPQMPEFDVTQQDRSDAMSRTKDRFEDIQKVYKNCDEFPVDLDSFSDTINVKGRLNLPDSIKYFEKIGANKFVLDTLRYGHHPNLSGPVPDYEIENHGSFRKHEEFSVQTIKDLIAKGRVEIVDKKPKLINPLHVVVQRLKTRLILDCSILNKYIVVPKIKYENHDFALQYFKKGIYMFNYDLKDGYHHLLIHPEFRDYLGFKLIIDGKLTFCRYVVGCFGLADLPFIYTKIYRPLLTHWRSLGIQGIKFLDDGGFFIKDKDNAEAYSLHVKKDLIRSGSVYSIKKCCWEPTQKMIWLGFSWDSEIGSIAAAPHRIEKIKTVCDTLLSKDNCVIRKLAGFVGMITSITFVVGNCSRVTTKRSQICVANSNDWDKIIPLTAEVKQELLFWKDNIDQLNCRLIFDNSPPKIFQVIEGDASSTGCGSYLNKEKLAARIFSEEERETHSTYRELANVHFSLYAFLPHIKNSSVKFLVDSQSAAKIVDTGSMKPELQWFATEIFHFCFKNNIALKVEWIPREQNQLADTASRLADIIDIEDWGLTPSFFSILNNRYGPFSLDAFANYYNAKCSKFYSLYHCPGSAGVDALTQNWLGENVLLVPPVNAIGNTLHHLRVCKAKGVLVAPKWPSGVFWPLLKNEFSEFIVEVKVFKGNKVLCHGLNKNSILGSPDFTGDIIAVSLDCTV